MTTVRTAISQSLRVEPWLADAQKVRRREMTVMEFLDRHDTEASQEEGLSSATIGGIFGLLTLTGAAPIPVGPMIFGGLALIRLRYGRPRTAVKLAATVGGIFMGPVGGALLCLASAVDAVQALRKK